MQEALALTVVPDDYDGRYLAYALVLQRTASEPAELCVGGVATSYPPQCGGPPIIGWTWDTIAHESASGVRWADWVRVVGRYDGTSFTLTEPARALKGDENPDGLPQALSTTPCAAPSGGWSVTKAAKATQKALQAAMARANADPGVADVWIDTDASVSPSAPSPANGVLNAATTSDVQALTTSLRELWGGALCVSGALHTRAELESIQRQMGDEESIQRLGVGIAQARVRLDVVRATLSQQRELDQRFGSGAVRLTGALLPIDG